MLEDKAAVNFHSLGVGQGLYSCWPPPQVETI